MLISPDYPFESRYTDILGSKIHYIEAGEGQPFLFLHGNPTWSYLWRNIMPPVAKYGRCIAPDLIGFGKSDKPDIGYTFIDHYKYIENFISKLDLRNIILVIHDWGGVLGFYYAFHHQQNVKGIAFMETFPFSFSWDSFSPKYRFVFRLFRNPLTGKFLIMILNIFVNKVLPASVCRGVSKEIHQNYKKPFPTIKSRYPIYVWPNELPIEGMQNKTFKEIKRLEGSLSEFTFPMLLFTCTPGGVIQHERIEWFRKTLKDLTLLDIGNGIHYIQEDNPSGIANGIIKWALHKKLVA